MIKKEVNINSIEKAKEFSNLAMLINSDVKLCSKQGGYVIDAKSIMGIFSLDLSKNVELVISDPTEKDKELIKKFDQFVVKSTN